MNAARIELKLVLDETGNPEINLDTFSQRFNMQKRVYLTQLMGYDLGYRYGWYIKGPYCRELTADAFTLRDEIRSGEEDYEAYELDASSKESIRKARQLWETPEGLRVSMDEWLELLASLHYLKHIAYWPPGSTKDFEAVFKVLIKSKPRFANARTTAQQAWNRLDGFGLIDAKTLQ